MRQKVGRVLTHQKVGRLPMCQEAFDKLSL